MNMTDPVISPDGKWMWTGSEWIPAPPTSAQAADSTINLEQLDLDFGDDYVSPSNKNQAQSNINIQDSAMKGNVYIKQKSDQSSSTINLTDSAMSGDINIAHNDIDGIVLGVRIAEHEKWAEGVLNAKPNLKPGWDQLARNYIEAKRRLIISTSTNQSITICSEHGCNVSVEGEKLFAPELQQYEYIFVGRSQYYGMCNFHLNQHIDFLVMWSEVDVSNNHELHNLYRQLGEEEFWNYISKRFQEMHEADKLVNGNQ